MLLWARLVARGSIAAMLLFTLVACWFLFVCAWGTLHDLTAHEDPGSIAGMWIGCGLLCFAATKGVLASIRHRQLARQTNHSYPKVARPRVAWDRRRLRKSAKIAALSLCVYVTALPVAFLAAAVFPIHALFGRFVYSPFANLGSRLYREAQQLAALGIAEVRAADNRAPVLFLRSFSDDELRITRKFGAGSILAPKTLTLEELLVDRLWNIGPVIALGKPGEGLSPLGAAREYLEGAYWQQRIRNLLAESKLFIALLGTTEGLTVEYEMISQMGTTGKLLAVFPPVTTAGARQRWRILQRSSVTSSDFPQADKCKPLVVLFPSGKPALFFACRYQNESAYLLALDIAMSSLEKQALPSALHLASSSSSATGAEPGQDPA